MNEKEKFTVNVFINCARGLFLRTRTIKSDEDSLIHKLSKQSDNYITKHAFEALKR